MLNQRIDFNWMGFHKGGETKNIDKQHYLIFALAHRTYIDTSTPMGKMIFTVLGAVAELERNLIKERVHMGISRARKQGKALGRPRVEVDPLQVAGLRSRGLSWNQIAETLSVGRGTAERAFKSLSQKPLRSSDKASLIQ